MGFRFRRTIKILPGIKINISKSGLSTSIGGPGATVNVKSGRKTKTTIGIPGTGLSHTSYSGSTNRESEGTNWRGVVIFVVFFGVIIAIAKSCSG
jgi:hypothetical protein